MGGRGALATESSLYICGSKGHQFLESFEALDGQKYLFLDTGTAFWGITSVLLPRSYTLL